uniref:Uncharacterized protein n=1 Tax=viral metagenome TaxID=1070528 RepID=A0A6C0H7J5_9ZZZZ
MSTTLDILLKNFYRSMTGLNGIITDVSNNTTFLGQVTINSGLYVSSRTIFNNLLTTNSNINIYNLLSKSYITTNNTMSISGITNINNMLTINSILNISGNATLYNNLLVSGPIILIGNNTINNQLNVMGIATLKTILSSIIQPINTDTLTINGNTINIGNNKSKIFIQGTSTYIGTTQLNTYDKFITLNINSSTYLGIDMGNNSGIQIMGTGGTGFIQSSNDGLNYLIQAPMAPNIGYIVTQQYNNNLLITGASTLQNDVSINSSLYISNISIIPNYITINKSLNVSGISIIYNNISLNSKLNISGDSIITNDISIINNLKISTKAILTNNTYINNNAFISDSIINGKLLLSSKISNNNNIIRGITTILSDLYVSGTSNIINILTVSSLTVIGTSIINNRVSIRTKLLASGKTIINSNISINSSLNISGSTFINSNVSLLSNINILGRMTAKLKNYNLNSAARIGGIPIGGLYRNGGIVVIRVNDVAPTIYLSGSSNLSIDLNTSYTDPGAYALTYNNNYILVYLTSISSYISNYSVNVLINGTSTLITNTSTLPYGNYTATYKATDPTGLIGYNYRSLNILYKLKLTKATFSASSFSTLFSIPGGGNCIGLSGIYYSGSTYVAIPNVTNSNGPQDANIWTSTDYYNWTCINIGSLSALSGISKPNIAQGDSLTCCAFGNGYLALNIQSNDTGNPYYFIYNISANTLTPFPSNGNNKWFNPTNLNNYCFYFMNGYIYSTDGNTFTQSITYLPYDMCEFNYVNGVYIIFLWNHSPNSIITYISSDRINWSFGTDLTQLLINNGIASPQSANARRAASNNSMCITSGYNYQGIASNSMFILYSTNGTNWTYVQLPYFPIRFDYVNWNNGNFSENDTMNFGGTLWTGNIWIVRFSMTLNVVPSGYVNPYGNQLNGFYFSQDGINWNVSTSVFYNGVPTNYSNNNGGITSTVANGKCIFPFSYTNMTTGLWYTS